MRDRHLLTIRRGPYADHVVVAVVEHRLRHLQCDRVHAVAGEEVLAAPVRACAAADRDEVEDRPDVREERIVTLACEHGAAVGERLDALRGERVVVRGRARPDVVGRGHEARSDDRRLPVDDLRNGVALLRVAEEELARQVGEPELPGDVRVAVAVRVGVDVVPGGRAERVVVRPGCRILTRDPVGDDRRRRRLVGRHERVQVRVVRRRVLRDQRCLAVTRRRGRAGAAASCNGEPGYRDGGCGEQGEYELLHVSSCDGGRRSFARAHGPVRRS